MPLQNKLRTLVIPLQQSLQSCQIRLADLRFPILKTLPCVKVLEYSASMTTVIVSSA
jgi:hypothetical protein